MAGGNAALEGQDDDEFFFNDDSFLAAIANVEAQHLGRMTNMLSSSGSRDDFNGNGGPENNGGVKRPAYGRWQNNTHDNSGELSRGETGSFGSFPRGEYSRSTHNEYETNPGRPSNTSRQAYEVQEACARNCEGQQPEGEYMAALRGSNSELWQLSGVGRGIGTTAAVYSNTAGTSGNNARGAHSGNCFKCGLEGHWSRDCPGGRALNTPSRQDVREAERGPSVAERLCACGAGACLVLTANTPKNMGRSFYRCPLRKDEGQCTFFEWCDSGGRTMPTERGNFQEFGQQPELHCQCGGGICVVRTAKTEKNLGRQFFKCPLPQSCSFFQWCDEAGRNARGNSSTSTEVTNRNTGSRYNNNGQGHFSSSYPNGKPGGTISAHGSDVTCYNCGNPGHWAQNCPVPRKRPRN